MEISEATGDLRRGNLQFRTGAAGLGDSGDSSDGGGGGGGGGVPGAMRDSEQSGTERKRYEHLQVDFTPAVCFVWSPFPQD